MQQLEELVTQRLQVFLGEEEELKKLGQKQLEIPKVLNLTDKIAVIGSIRNVNPCSGPQLTGIKPC